MPSNGHGHLLHEALVYSSEEAFLARLVPFLRDGFEAGQPTIVLLRPKNVTLLREALGQDAERVAFADWRAHYRRPAHAIAEFRRRLDSELSRPGTELVRIVGELQFGTSAQEDTEWTRYESMVNRGFATYPAWIVCAYDTRVLPEQAVADAHCTHQIVSSGGKRETSVGYIETDEVFEPPLAREGAPGGDSPFVSLTVTKERDFDELRRVVAGAARAAGLAPSIVEDVTVAAAELVRDALRDGDGGASVQVTRDGARWHCEVTDHDFDSSRTSRGNEIGLSIARLISERVELASGAGAKTVRLSFTGAADARQRILDAASELFYQNGIRATGINTIIAHSGVAKATFFHHFRAKDELVIAWLQRPASRWFDRIRAELDAKTESPTSRLLTFFDLLGEWFAQDDFRGCAFQNAAAETPDAAHPVRQITDDYTLEIQRYLRNAAKDAGLSHPARIAEQLHLLAQGAIATAVATRSPEAAKVGRAAAKRLLALPARQPA